MKKVLVASLTMLAAAAANTASEANATDVFRLEGFGPISRAMGGTAAANNVGAAGMMTNPATLSLMEQGQELSVGLDLVTTDIATKNLTTGERASSGQESNNRGPYFAPELAYTWRDGPLSLGAGAFAQGGLGTEYGKNSFLSRATGGLNTGLPNSSRLLVLNVPVAASYDVTDKLTVGGSVDAMWQGLNLGLLLGVDQVGSLIGAGRVSGSLVPLLGTFPALRGVHFNLSKDSLLASGVDSWGVGGRLGMTYKVTPDTVVGAAYTLKSQFADLKGRATLTAVDAIAGQVSLDGTIRLRNFQMPAHADIGISHKFDEQWTVAADLSRVFWRSAMKNIDVAFVTDAGPNLNVLLPQKYNDQTVLGLGVAYRIGDWTLRGGVRLATQAVSSENLFAVIPATPTKHVSAGFAYRVTEKGTVNFAYSHAFADKLRNGSLPNTSAPIEVTNSEDNFVLSYSQRF